MDNSYKNNLKNKLKNIRERKDILESRDKKFSVSNNPLYFLNFISNLDAFPKLENIREKIYEEKILLDFEYNLLMDEYRNRFRHLGNSELVDKYDSLNRRTLDLDSRYSEVKSLQKDDFLFKISKANTRVKNALEKVSEERDRRVLARDDALNEIWSRGICLEMAYTQNMFEFKD